MSAPFADRSAGRSGCGDNRRRHRSGGRGRSWRQTTLGEGRHQAAARDAHGLGAGARRRDHGEPEPGIAVWHPAMLSHTEPSWLGKCITDELLSICRQGCSRVPVNKVSHAFPHVVQEVSCEDGRVTALRGRLAPSRGAAETNLKLTWLADVSLCLYSLTVQLDYVSAQRTSASHGQSCQQWAPFWPSTSPCLQCAG